MGKRIMYTRKKSLKMTGMRISRILTHTEESVCMLSNLYNTNQDEIDIVMQR